MDNFFSTAPSFLYALVVGAVTGLRGRLLQCRSAPEVSRVMESECPVDMDFVLRRAFEALQLLSARSVEDRGKWVPLARGSYPPFDSHYFPEFSVNHQLLERRRIEADETLLLEQQATLEKVTRQNTELVQAQQLWRAQEQLVKVGSARDYT